MTEAEIAELLRALDGVSIVVAAEDNDAPEAAWGDSFFFYDPDDTPDDRRMPFATIVTNDYAGFDTASQLDRPDVFRLNIRIGRDAFRELFGEPPGPTDVDHAAFDHLMPHPVYARQSWVSIVNPSDAGRSRVAALLSAAHGRAVERHAGRNAEMSDGDR